MKLGKFIVIEGIDGSGKTSIVKLIKKILKKKNIKKIYTVREPGSTLMAEKIRKIIKYNFYKEKINYKTELLLMYAARNQLMNNVIKPAIKKGKWIIGDRHILSTLAYQGGKNGKNQKLIYKIHKQILKKIYPNLTIYLDINPKIAMKRISNRNNLDRIEKKSENFFIRTRKNYLKAIKNFKNVVIINSNYNINNVHKIIKKYMYIWLKKNKI